MRPDYVADPATVLRLCADKMWSFVGSKKQPRWLWWVEEAPTGRVLPFVLGRRTHATFRRPRLHGQQTALFLQGEVQPVMTHAGLLVELYLHAGSEADITGLKALSPQLPEGSVVYADTADTDYAWEDAWQHTEQVRRVADRRKGSKRPLEPWQRFLLQHFRKGMETTISQITERFPKSIHAVTAQGFALKILLLVLTHTLTELGA